LRAENGRRGNRQEQDGTQQTTRRKIAGFQGGEGQKDKWPKNSS
jgi:hypothetical protein